MAASGEGTHLFLGVDGGGTKTRARVRDEAGRALGEAEAGPGNVQLGEPAWAEVMRASREALSAAGIAEPDFGRVHAGFGLAGTQPRADREAVLARPHPFASLAVDTDAWAAYLGAWAGAEGAILVLGTGSCGVGIARGNRIRIGGWGHDVGDDGSGMAIGRLALRRALWALEGMAPVTPLAEAVLARFDRDPERMVAWAATAIPGDYASFAPAVFDHAGRGDGLARAVVEEAVRGAIMHIDRLLELGAPKIAMIGGVFPPLLPWLPDRVRPFLVEPPADAMDGAILMAKQNAGL